MVVKYYLATVGEHTKPTIMRALLLNGCNKLFLFPSKATRKVAEEIVAEVHRLFHIREYEIIEVEPLDIWSTTIKILKIIVELKKMHSKNDDEVQIIVDITGGTRIMTLAAALAAVKAGINPRYYIYLKERDDVVEKEIPHLLVTHEKIGYKKEIILKSLYWLEEKNKKDSRKEEKKQVTSLSQLKKIVEDYRSFGEKTKIGKSISKYSEDTEFLATNKLILKPKHPKQGEYKLTHAGRAFVEILQLSKVVKELRDNSYKKPKK